ncbi:FAD/NAD(P)-binding domain-containing protein [Lipomyces doorenjongii]
MAAPTIAIIGGGPCGLTLARLLECAGIDYVVYERDERQEALLKCGLFAEFKRYARYDDTVFALADKLGKKLLQVGQSRDAPEIDRSDLRQILLDAIPKDRIKWGHDLRNTTVGEDNRPVLHFANGVVLSGFKLVVGADGAWSKVRHMITEAIPQYSGKIFLESKIGHENPLYEKTVSNVGAGTILVMADPELTLGSKSQRTSSNNDTVDLQDVEATRGLLLSDFYADWAEESKDLIRHAVNFRAWPLYTLSTEDMGWKSVSGVTLVGDATHFSFTNGEGANLAMTDSLKLASKIAAQYGNQNFDQAVQEYEADMFPRGDDYRGQGNGNGYV